MPSEVREAQDVLDRKSEVLAQADEEAALRLARADEEVERRISESEISKAAEARSQEIIAQAQAETERMMQEAQAQADAKRAEGERLASEQMDEADRYAMEMLRKLEQQLGAFSSSVRAGIETLDRSPQPAPTPDQPDVQGYALPREVSPQRDIPHQPPQQSDFSSYTPPHSEVTPPVAPPPVEDVPRASAENDVPRPSFPGQEVLEPTDDPAPEQPDDDRDDRLQHQSG